LAQVTTVDPGYAEHLLGESYHLSGGARISRAAQDFYFSQVVVPGFHYAATRFQATSEIEYWGPNDGLWCVEHVHSGRLSFDTARDEVRIGSGDICLVPPHDPWRAYSQDVDLAPFLLSRDEVEAHAVAACGIEPGSLTFTGLLPISPAAEALWKKTVGYVHHLLLNAPALADAPLAQVEAFRLLATCMLTAFPNTALEALDQPVSAPRGVEASTVRRVVAFIDANAHRPIGLADITEAAKTDARSLRSAFLRHRDCTPLGYLQQVRIAGAHRDLRAGDPLRGDTVEMIAARWGFPSISAFWMAYRRAYGCSPSQTLGE
jgi:AraC-like DNA-binding protein